MAVYKLHRPTCYSKCCACGAAGAPDCGPHTYVYNNRSYAAIVVVSVDSGGCLVNACPRGTPHAVFHPPNFLPCALCDLCLIQIRVRIMLRTPCWNRSPRAATAGRLACASRARSHLRSDPYGGRGKRIDPGNAEVIWAISVLPSPGRQKPTRRPGSGRRRPGTAGGSRNLEAESTRNRSCIIRCLV